MPAQTRLNSNQQIEVFIESLQGYALMVAPFVVEEGYPVNLTPENRAKLDTLIDSLEALKTEQSSGAVATAAAATTTQLQQLRQNDLTQIQQLISARVSGQLFVDTLETVVERLDTLINGQGGNGSGGTAVTAGVQHIATLELTDADTQYEFEFPTGTVRYAFTCRDDRGRNDPIGDVRFSWEDGKVAGVGGGQGIDNYEVLAPQFEEGADQFFAQNTKLYFASTVPGVVLTIRRWDNAAI